MAHYVVCPICGKRFDRDKAEVVPYGARRYAHKECSERKEAVEFTQEQKDKKALEEYIMKLFNTDHVEPIVQKQIKKYITENKYTYSGILKALIYFYEIKKGDISKANGRISIVEYIYSDAKRYYYSIWEAQQQNKVKKIEDFQKPKDIEIVIPPPQRVRKRSKLFRFLEEEDD